MWGQTHFGGFVKGEHTTISGGLVKLVWNACILKYHNRFCIAKTFDFSNKSVNINFENSCDTPLISVKSPKLCYSQCIGTWIFLTLHGVP